MNKIASHIFLILLGGLSLAEVHALEPDTRQAAAARSLMAAPLYFEANQGQFDDAVKFIARGANSAVQLSAAEAVLEVGQGGQLRTVRLTLAGARSAAELSGRDELAGRANYFIGQSADQWRVGVPLYSRVQLKQAYPGIDVVYYADHAARLEYDFVLQPGADPRQIALSISGADQVRLDAAGNLVLKIGGQEIRQHKPVIYQMVNGARREIPGGYRLAHKTTASFWVGDYDHALPLVIDPVIDATYLGGKYGDAAWNVAVDAAGSVYVCGDTFSPNLVTNSSPVVSGSGSGGIWYDGIWYPGPWYGGIQYGGTQGFRLYGDGFIAKYRSTNGVLTLDYFSYLGGKGQESAQAVAVDDDGYAYVTGFTDSPNFPFYPTNAAYTNITGYHNTANNIFRVDAFVMKLAKDGRSLIYSTYLGGGERDAGYAIAVKDGYAYVAGFTESTNFPVVSTLPGIVITNTKPGKPLTYTTNLLVVQQKFGGVRDAFLAKVDLDGTRLVYSTYLGGTNQESAYGLAVDTADCAYLAGYTLSTNFPTVPLHNSWLNQQTNRTSFFDAFFTKVSADGTSNIFSTFLGGENSESGTRLALAPDRSAGSVYVTGYTFSTNFPVTTVITNTRVWTNPKTNSFADIFVTKFSLLEDGTYTTNTPGYSVVFGGKYVDEALGIAVDNAGDAIITGFTSSTNLFNIYVETNYFTYKTNSNRVITTNHVYLTNFDTGENILNSDSATSKKGNKYDKYLTNNVFVAVINPDATEFNYAALFGGNGNDMAYAVAFDANLKIAYVVGNTTSTNFPTVPYAPRASSKQNTNEAFVMAISLTDFVSPGSLPKPAGVSVAPTIYITFSEGNVTLTWPDVQPVLVLEGSPSLSPADWQTVNEVPNALDGWLSVTLPATDPSRYFRLHEALPSSFNSSGQK